MASCGISQGIKDEFNALDLNNDGMLQQSEYAAARQGAGNAGGGGGGDCEDCVQVVKNWKTVQVPCTRNTYKQYTIKVPRQITTQVPRTVKFTKMEKRQKTVPYTVTRMENRTKFESINVKVPVTKTVTKMQKVVRKVPKTIYVNVTSMEPRQETVTEFQNRTKQIKIPYQVPIKETKYQNVTYEEPVTMSKTVLDKVQKTVFDTQYRTRCVPKTSMVSKRIPVYNVVAKPPAPCPPDMPCGQDNSGGGGGQFASEFKGLDLDHSGGLDLQEYAKARMAASGGGGGASMQASASSSMQVSGGGAQYTTEFKSLDIDSSGGLDLQEYAKARMGASSGGGGGYGMMSSGGGASSSHMQVSGGGGGQYTTEFKALGGQQAMGQQAVGQSMSAQMGSQSMGQQAMGAMQSKMGSMQPMQHKPRGY